MIYIKNIKRSLLLILTCCSLPALAETDNKVNEDAVHKCIAEKLKTANDNFTVKQLRNECSIEQLELENSKDYGAISQRIIGERATEFNPYVITPHKMNYILPISVTDKINRETYEQQAPDSGWAENFEDYESKYQLSIKVPLVNSIFKEGDSLHFGFTVKSWWQVYSEGVSKPFRETNYQPEVFYLMGLDWHPFGGNTGLIVGAEHQSNGRSTAISRSWNRIYSELLFEKGNYASSLRLWHRLEEDEKESPDSPDGDDNPDITDYMGYMEFTQVYEYESLEFSMRAKENFATHKGGLELGVTFPLWGRLRGYVQGYTGYGESLIDYNLNQNRISVGIALTDIL